MDEYYYNDYYASEQNCGDYITHPDCVEILKAKQKSKGLWITFGIVLVCACLLSCLCYKQILECYRKRCKSCCAKIGVCCCACKQKAKDRYEAHQKEKKA